MIWGAPLLVAFIAAAANIGEPERMLGLIAALGIAIHIVSLKFYRRKLRRSGTLPNTSASAAMPVQAAIDDLRQSHVAHAYLLGALKLRTDDEITRQLAGEAEDSAYKALALIDHVADAANLARPSGKQDGQGIVS